MNCKNCGERLEGDGYTTVLHCPNAEAEGYTPDDNAVYCTVQVATEEERNAMNEMAMSKLEDVEETEKDAQDAINDYYIGGV